jgi:glycosyltransferase involved in cell wall biosynthesis
LIDQTNPDYANTPASARRPQFGYRPEDATAAPCVSIVTPFYNTGVVFHETVRSVLGQSFQQWEWLIVNDGSSNPEALSILDGYRSADPRVRVVDLEVNGGPSRARNAGFRLARAEYVVCLDTDNLLEPTAIEKWLWFLESYPEYGFAKGYTVGFGAQDYLHNRGFHEGDVFLHENLVDMSSMIRKRIHKAVGEFDESIREGMEDWDFWLRCASYGLWGGTVPEYLDWYRRRPSHADRWADWDCGERQQSFHEKLRERYPELWAGGFPRVSLRPDRPNDLVPDDLPCENRLRKEAPRLLLVVPWLEMGGPTSSTWTW